MDFTKSLDKKAHARLAEKQSRHQRFSQLQSIQGQFSTKIRSDLKRRPHRPALIVRTTCVDIAAR